MKPAIRKLSKAGSSDDIEIGLYSLDRTLRLLRQVGGLAQLLFPRFAIFSESLEDYSIRIGRPPDTIFIDAGAKEITAKMKLPRL